MTDRSNPFYQCNLKELPLESVKAHDGIGYVKFNRFVTRQTIDGECNFMDYTVMPPGTTIGLHSHALDEEEFYLILSGVGQMTRDGDEFSVKAGDLIRNTPGGSHSLKNSGQDDLRLFVLELKVKS